MLQPVFTPLLSRVSPDPASEARTIRTAPTEPPSQAGPQPQAGPQRQARPQRQAGFLKGSSCSIIVPLENLSDFL